MCDSCQTFRMRYLSLLCVLTCLPACGGGNDETQSKTEVTDGSETGDSREFSFGDFDAVEQPKPLLPNKDADTPLGDLTDKEFKAACEPFLETATEVVSSAAQLCQIAAFIQAANDETAESDKDFQAACKNAQSECDTASVLLEATTEATSCGDATDCDATLGELNECRRSLVIAHEAVLIPAGGWSLPDCTKTTARDGRSLATQLTLLLGVAAVQLSVDAEQPESNACSAVQEKCPNLAQLPDIAGG